MKKRYLSIFGYMMEITKGYSTFFVVFMLLLLLCVSYFAFVIQLAYRDKSIADYQLSQESTIPHLETLEQFFSEQTDWSLHIEKTNEPQGKAFFKKNSFIQKENHINIVISTDMITGKKHTYIQTSKKFKPPCPTCFDKRMEELQSFIEEIDQEKSHFFYTKRVCFGIITYFQNEKISNKNHQFGKKEMEITIQRFLYRYPQYENIINKTVRYAQIKIKELQTIEQFKKAFIRIEKEQEKMITSAGINNEDRKRIMELLQKIHVILSEGLGIILEKEDIDKLETPWQAFVQKEKSSMQKLLKETLQKLKSQISSYKINLTLSVIAIFALCTLAHLHSLNIFQPIMKIFKQRKRKPPETRKKNKIKGEDNEQENEASSIEPFEREETRAEKICKMCKDFDIESPLLLKSAEELTETELDQLEEKIDNVRYIIAHRKKLHEQVIYGESLIEKVLDVSEKETWAQLYKTFSEEAKSTEKNFRSLRGRIVEKNNELRVLIRNQ